MIGTLILYYLLILAILPSTMSQPDVAQLFLVSQERGASCLDGSAPGIYIHEGKGQNKSNFIIYFQGGGFCGGENLQDTLQDCYSRSKDHYGTSKLAAPTMDLLGYGVLSPSAQENPSFYDWTRVVVLYCDGHEYAGHRESPIMYKETSLFFRGSRNVKEVFRTMDQKYDWYNGGKILIGGGSAGGIATYQWSNYLAEKTKKAKIYAIPDSGLFLTNWTNPFQGKQVLRDQVTVIMNLVYNETEMPDTLQQCVKQPGLDIVDCFNVANYAKFIKVPFFMVQSPYDQFSLKNILGLKCLTNPHAPYSISTCNQTEMKAIDDYRLATIAEIKSMRGDRKDVGVWAPACVQHSFQHELSFNSPKYEVRGRTISQAVSNFVNNPEQADWLLDQITWPNNKGCNGLDNLVPQLKFE